MSPEQLEEATRIAEKHKGGGFYFTPGDVETLARAYLQLKAENERLVAVGKRVLGELGHNHLPDADVEGSGIRQLDDGTMERFCPREESRIWRLKNCTYCMLKDVLANAPGRL